MVNVGCCHLQYNRPGFIGQHYRTILIEKLSVDPRLGTGIRLGTMFHDGSKIENCPNQTDAENSDWYCGAPSWCYPVAIVGTAMAAVGQPFMLVLPTKLAAQWFNPDERDIANSIAALANPLGIMVASILAPIIVNEPSDLKYLQIYFAIPVLLSFITSLFIRQEGYHLEEKEDSFKVKGHNIL